MQYFPHEQKTVCEREREGIKIVVKKYVSTKNVAHTLSTNIGITFNEEGGCRCC